MSFGFNLQIDGLEDLQQNLSGLRRQIPKITERSLNKAITGVKTDASKLIRQEITAKKKNVDRTMRVFKASVRRGVLSTALESTGKAVPLAGYKVRQLRSGVKVSVRKDTPAEVIPHSFLATMSTGHRGVFQREIRHKDATSNIPFSRAGRRRPPKQYAAMGRKTDGRKYVLPIKELFGPAIPSIMRNQDVMTTLKRQAKERARNAFQHEIDRAIQRQLGESS